MIFVFFVEEYSSYGVYLHIPFCRRRCFYCDFPIKVVGDRKSSIEYESEQYTSLILEEMHKTISLHRINSFGNKFETGVDTIYFGGGTPSLLPNSCKNLI
jgi:oxygen-independent coproporphyrinogen-3 oxidase